MPYYNITNTQNIGQTLTIEGTVYYFNPNDTVRVDTSNILTSLPTGFSLNYYANQNGPALEGIDINGSSMPAGGAGIRGWLSTIATRGIPSIGATNPNSIIANRQIVSTTAGSLPSQALVNGVIVTALPNNSSIVYVGPSGVTVSTGYPLAAGQSVSCGVANLNSIYIIGTNITDSVAFIGN